MRKKINIFNMSFIFVFLLLFARQIHYLNVIQRFVTELNMQFGLQLFAFSVISVMFATILIHLLPVLFVIQITTWFTLRSIVLPNKTSNQYREMNSVFTVLISNQKLQVIRC